MDLGQTGKVGGWSPSRQEDILEAAPDEGKGDPDLYTTEGEMVGFNVLVIDGPFALAFWQLREHSGVNSQEKQHSLHNLTLVCGARTLLKSCQEAQHFNYSNLLRGHFCF